MFHRNCLGLLYILIGVLVSQGGMAMTKAVVFSEVTGQILSNGKPVKGAEVIRRVEYKELYSDSTTTDTNGYFKLPAIEQNRGFTLFPSEFVVAQTIHVKTQQDEHQIWSNTKRAKQANSELGGKPLNLICDLQDGLKVFKEFGSILRTNCRWDSDLKSHSTQEFVLAEHFANMDWFHALPEGLISETISLKHNAVAVEKSEDGHSIYVGPINPDLGGGAITIWLNKNLELINYEIEQIEPVPKFD